MRAILAMANHNHIKDKMKWKELSNVSPELPPNYMCPPNYVSPELELPN